MASISLKIPNKDRIGLVHDISKVLATHQINIISMEVSKNVMYIEVDSISENMLADLARELVDINHIDGIEIVGSMPHQKREQQLTTLMDTIGEGIVAIDHNGIVTHFNAAAANIVGYTSDEILGKNIGLYLGRDLPMLNTLRNGTAYNNKEIFIKTPKGKRHYVTSGRPIRDKKNNTIGVVAVLKAMHDVQDLVNTVTRPQVNTFSDILFVSDAMQSAINLAKLVAQNDSSVLIRGESGTGKELFARAIHMDSPRCEKIFAPINCAALPDALLESELFGYEEGAFTGANKGGKKGLFEYASGGTIFFDEIGELSANLQAKLLRLLQEGTVRRIGGHRELPVDVRIIAATHRNLEEMLGNNEFRGDLYYRLNVIPIHIPPLRDRKEDLPILIDSLLLKTSHRLKKQISGISKTASEMLMAHSWHGNVRELQNVIERAVSIACHGEISESHIMLDYDTQHDTSQIPNVSSCNFKEALDQVERSMLQKALAQYGTSRKMGKALGLSHTAVLNRIRKYNLHE